ncbi:hypothetical protein QQF64_003205 [Cirrhinus molitorella]|uniref:Uncharacterized protein n=1 Tax=Cirrhinus molitorella TaxID=172907 RepID=A0ABR3MJF1_9TELE
MHNLFSCQFMDLERDLLTLLSLCPLKVAPRSPWVRKGEENNFYWYLPAMDTEYEPTLATDKQPEPTHATDLLTEETFFPEMEPTAMSGWS